MKSLRSGQLSARAEPISQNPFKTGRLASWTLIDLGPVGLSPAINPVATAIPASMFSVIRHDEVYIMSCEGLAHFRIDPAGRTITAFNVSPQTTEAAMSHLLFDHLAPRILAHEGELVLHGAAVAIEGAIGGAIVAFLGETGAGKSTLAASLHLAGHRLLGDDAVIVTKAGEVYLGEPVYPSLRLYPEAVAALIGDGAKVTPMAHYSDKKRVDVGASSLPPLAPMPLSCLFFLTPVQNGAAPAALPLSPREACIRLIEQSFALDPNDAAIAASRLGEMARLAEAVPAFELHLPHRFDRLRDAHAVIFDCLAQGPAGAQ